MTFHFFLAALFALANQVAATSECVGDQCSISFVQYDQDALLRQAPTCEIPSQIANSNTEGNACNVETSAIEGTWAIAEGDTCEPTCATGYTAMKDGDAVTELTCNCPDGACEEIVFTCEESSCPLPEADEDAGMSDPKCQGTDDEGGKPVNYDKNNDVPSGESCTPSCDEGYKLEEAGTVLECSLGTFSPSSYACVQEASCPEITDANSCSKSDSGCMNEAGNQPVSTPCVECGTDSECITASRSTCTLRCAEGYTPMVDCSDPSDPVNGCKNDEAQKLGDAIKCTDGAWDLQDFACVESDCDQPDVPFGSCAEEGKILNGGTCTPACQNEGYSNQGREPTVTEALTCSKGKYTLDGEVTTFECLPAGCNMTATGANNLQGIEGVNEETPCLRCLDKDCEDTEAKEVIEHGESCKPQCANTELDIPVTASVSRLTCNFGSFGNKFSCP